MGNIVKFLLKVFLFLVILGIAIGLIEQFGGILIVIVAIGVVVAVMGKFSRKSSQSKQEPSKPKATPAPEPVKKTGKDEIEKLHVDMDD